MPAPLVPVVFPSIYKVGGAMAPVPKRMAFCTPDTKLALLALSKDVEAAGGQLRLSDLFRSRDMQLQAHMDFVSGKKSAFSPAPGGSMHEAGRAFDIDVGNLGITLKKFWELAARRGVVPIIKAPDPSASEAWHFECRGTFATVLKYYASGQGTNMKAARAMAAAAIAALGIELDDFPGRNKEVRLQSALIRLGGDPGNIDGSPGARTRKAVEAMGIAGATLEEQLQDAEARLAQVAPTEWHDKSMVEDNPSVLV
jgi:hypothetical protein